jgi:endonuclease IV
MSIGLHVGKNSKLFENKHKTMMSAIKTEVETFNLSAISMFQIGPLNKNKNSMDHQGIKAYCLEKNVAIYPHGSYIAAGIWQVNKANRHENKPKMFIRLIKDQLVQGKQVGAKGVVFHVPRHPINTIVETMTILSDCKVINSVRRNEGDLPMFTLEMPSSRADDLLTYETPQKLNALCAALADDPKITLPWDICIDTCHMWAGGIDFSKDLSWNDWESELSELSRSKLSLIHLNGAQGKNFGTGKDGHVIPCSRDDSIWGKLISDEFRDFIERSTMAEINSMNLATKLSESEMERIKSSSFFAIIQFAKKQQIGMIMEINAKDYKNAKFALDLVNLLLTL